MENASKALLMAAGVLIGVLILSLAVYLFANFGTASAEIHKQRDMNEINKFNTQFTSYEGKECTIHDIVSVANLAINNNTNYSLTAQTGNNYYITVNIQSGQQNLQKYLLNTTTSKIDNDKVNELIKNDSNNLKYYTDSNGEQQISLQKYTCTTIINTTTQRVQTVTFKKM